MAVENEILVKMGSILDQLIAISERMNQLTTQVISEDELNALQTQQSEWMNQLVELDEKCHQLPSSQIKPENAFLRERNSEKIAQFEKLNNAFIENIASAHGIIHFEGKGQKGPKGPKKHKVKG